MKFNLRGWIGVWPLDLGDLWLAVWVRMDKGGSNG